jgi:hypothetical protein
MVDINYYDVNGRPQNTGLMQTILAIFGDTENPPEVQQKIAQILRNNGKDPGGRDWDTWDVPALAQQIQAAVPEYKMPSQTFNIVKTLPPGKTAPAAAPTAITGEQILSGATPQSLTAPGEAYTASEGAKLSNAISPPPPAPAGQPAGAATAPPTTSGVPAAWNQDYATQWGRAYGFLSPTEVATGGLLDSRVKEAGATDMYQKAQAAANAGQGQDIEAAIDAEIARQKADPSYGQLTKTYKDPKPFALSDYIADPGYQFRLEQGNKAINNAQAARGSFFSGRALKEAVDYNSGAASDEFTGAYNRYNNDYSTGYNKFKADGDTLYSRLGGLINTGTGATNTAVNANQNNATAQGNIAGQVGNAKAGAALNNGLNNQSMFNGLSGLLGQSQYSSTKLPWQTSGYINPATGRSY